ncbi:AAA domain protein [compost metagenome]
MSVTLAAKMAHVEPRTWRSWEIAEDKDTARTPSPAALWSFFARSGIEMPEISLLDERRPRGLAFSIASSKGGVGKTPITLDIAACLVEKGFQVAVVTDDLVYRFAQEDGQQPVPGSLVSQIDFYDELDLITFPADVKQRRKAMRERQPNSSLDEEVFVRAQHTEELKALDRKQRATEKLSELIARYDYVLIDVNGAIELIRRFANLVAIVVNTRCLMSVRAAGRFAAELREIKCRETTPSYFGLLTNCEMGGVSSELEEFIADHVEMDEAESDRLLMKKHRIYQVREQLMEKIQSLDFPLLHTELTGAHSVAMEMYEMNPVSPQECDYFDSLLDYAPKSHAAREIRRLTDELINWRL